MQARRTVERYVRFFFRSGRHLAPKCPQLPLANLFFTEQGGGVKGGGANRGGRGRGGGTLTLDFSVFCCSHCPDSSRQVLIHSACDPCVCVGVWVCVCECALNPILKLNTDKCFRNAC